MGDTVVVTSLPKPKLTRKELVVWLKTQTDWMFECNAKEWTAYVGYSCASAKTLSSAIRKLRKVMGQ